MSSTPVTPNLQNRRQHTSVWVTFEKIGFHCYPQAPDEVAYLRERHRHVFKFRVEITVHHDDREIEFHMMKNWLTSLYDIEAAGEGYININHKSCEMLAKELIARIQDKYDCSNRCVEVTVSEDGENGATVVNEPSSH